MKAVAGFCCVVLLYFTAEFITPPDRDGRKVMWIFPLLIVIGGVASYVYRGPLPELSAEAAAAADQAGKDCESFGVGPVVGGILITVIVAIFFATFIATNVLEYEDNKQLFWFSAFYRTGAVIWGGGQVVLPLLENEVVATGWIERPMFFTGLALAQAMPGPLFNFAAFLGAAAGRRAYNEVPAGIAGAGVAWLGLFGPGVALIFGILPFWGKFRSNETYKRLLPGLNAAAVGLLIASCVQMMASVRENNTKPLGPIPREASTCIGLFAFWAIHFLKVPDAKITQVQAPLVVVSGGLLGILAGLLDMK